MRGLRFLRLKRPKNSLTCALLLTASTALFNGCASKPKGVLVAFPDYFEIPANTVLVAPMDFGDGQQPTTIKTVEEMGCYSAKAQVDVLAVKKGVK